VSRPGRRRRRRRISAWTRTFFRTICHFLLMSLPPHSLWTSKVVIWMRKLTLKIWKMPVFFSWRFFEIFNSRVSVSTKINHLRSNYRHKIRFQDIVYLKLNKWRAKILKNIEKKNSTWCVIRKQEILFLLCRATNWIRKNELIIDFGLQNETDYNRFLFFYYNG